MISQLNTSILLKTERNFTPDMPSILRTHTHTDVRGHCWLGCGVSNRAPALQLLNTTHSSWTDKWNEERHFNYTFTATEHFLYKLAQYPIFYHNHFVINAESKISLHQSYKIPHHQHKFDYPKLCNINPEFESDITHISVIESELDQIWFFWFIWYMFFLIAHD